jgi:limonene-1,2-epoxide hydrolase
MSENQQIVLDFIQAVNKHDINRALTYLDTECFYHNIPIKPVTGTEAIKRVLAPMLDVASKVDWNVHNIAETVTGNVLTERTDRFLIKGIWVEVPVMGTFEIHDGKITAWRDYFDVNQVISQWPESADSLQ